MKKYKSLSIFVLLLISSAGFAQNKLLLLDGKIKEVKQYELKGDLIFYKIADADDKGRSFFLWNAIWPKNRMRKVDKFDVFSATDMNGKEEIIYDPDTIVEGDPGVAQVRNYIIGEQYGMSAYHQPWNKVEGAIAGLGSGFLSFYGPAGVFVNSIVMSRFNSRNIPPTSLVEPVIFNSQEFKAGYYKYARNKKIKDTLIFGGIGFAVSFALLAIVVD